MRVPWLGPFAVAIAWAGLVAPAASAPRAAQNASVATRDLLTRYANGDRSLGRAESLPVDARIILRDLPAAGTALLKSDPAHLERSRRLIATFVIEVARIAVNTGQARSGFDLIDWARTRLVGVHPEPGRDLPRTADLSQSHFSPPDDFDRDWYHAAMALVENEYSPDVLDVDTAKALKQCPGDSRLLLAAAVAAEQLVDRFAAVGQAPPATLVERARVRFAAAAAAPDTFGEARLRFGHVELESSHPDQALPYFDDALSHLNEPGLLYVAHLFAGRAFERLNRPDDARQAYAAALTLVPGAQSATLALAALALAHGDRERADDLSRGLLAGPPVNADPWSTYGAGDARIFRRLSGALQGDLQ